MTKIIFFCCLLLAPAAVSARNCEFDCVVSEVESHFNRQRIRIPLMGLISFVSNVCRPAGAYGFKLAVVEGIDSDAAGMALNLTGKLGSEWTPVVRVRERSGRSTAIYGRPEGDWMSVLLVAVGGRDATVMQFRLRPTRFLRWVGEKVAD